MKKQYVFLLSFFLFLFILILVIPSKAFGNDGKNVSCSNRFLTLVNPVRSRDLWYDKSLKPIQDQYSLIKKYGFPANWLLQFDVLKDNLLTSEIQHFDQNQEIGVFLEVSPKFTEDALVSYPAGVAWFEPKAVFLSGYAQSERRRLIDTLFNKFKERFGYFPKSVGAWWIDSYSLKYLKNKYGVKTAMIVADQKTTDKYGVWGQWWGLPYYPTEANVLVPAKEEKDKLDLVVIQWAQRDPDLAFGDGPAFSNFSLQANDYVRQGKDIKFFENLVNYYLDCQNPLGQITVGLETGIESVGYIGEYGRELNYLKSVKNLKVDTMSGFYDDFKDVFKENTKANVLGNRLEGWNMTTYGRSNNLFGENINYHQGLAFGDYFIADKSNFLNRRLDQLKVSPEISQYFPFYLVVLVLLFGVSYYLKRTYDYLFFVSFLVGSFGLLLRSRFEYGWEVFYGPQVPFLKLLQVIVVVVVYLIWVMLLPRILKIVRNSKVVWLIPLSYGLDWILQLVRFTKIEGVNYLGLIINPLRIMGLTFSKKASWFFDKTFSSNQIDAILKIRFNNLWGNQFFYFLINPLIHILFGLLIALLVNKYFNKRSVAAVFILSIFGLLFVLYLNLLFSLDPLSIKKLE